ncbi:MAG: hypothetical protein LBU27_06680 [Candidatus Peribacteria bacterium]|jgi:plasmid maintenance system antidote protein VapI|nr:hypothetical protein [Candidatus Peribacteria bacterium]
MRIGEAFGTGPELWINLQTMYDLWLAKQNKEELKELSFIHKRRPLFTPQLEERYLSTIATA